MNNKNQIIARFKKYYENLIMNKPTKTFSIFDIPLDVIDNFIEINNLQHHYYSILEKEERKILKKWNIKTFKNN